MPIHISRQQRDTDLRNHSLIAEARLGTGRAPSPLQTVVEPWQEHRRVALRAYVTSTTVTHHPVPSPHDPLVQGFRDAADECRHGALPTDRVVACGCWDLQELAA